MLYPKSMQDEAIRLHEQGLSIRAIVKELVFPSRMTVWRWVNGTHDGPDAKLANDTLLEACSYLQAGENPVTHSFVPCFICSRKISNKLF